MQFAEYGCEKTWMNVTRTILAFQDSKEPILIKNELFGRDPIRHKRKYLRVKSDLGWSYVVENGNCFFYELAQPCIGDFALTHNTPLVEFIIPSIGRPTVLRTLQSIEATRSTQYQILVVFDGIKENDPQLSGLPTTNAQIQYLHIPKIGFANCAGEVRNQGIKKNNNTEWIAFVDDDDQITPDYMYRFQQEMTSHPTADVIVFRMLQENKVIPQGNTIRCDDVGISFAMKRNLFVKNNQWFKPGSKEDFDLLNRLQHAKCNIHISSFITYLVR